MGKVFKLKRAKKVNSDRSLNSMIESIPWEKRDDPFKIYNEIKELGNGSMGKVIHVEKKEDLIGGSAYTPSIKNPKRSKLKRMFRRKKETENTTRKSFIIHTDKKSALVYEPIKFEYAMKMIPLERISPKFCDELRNEIEILRSLDHPNIVKVYEIYDLKEQIYVIMELCSGGDLWSRCPCDEERAIRIISSLTSAVAHMHKMGISHRDIKMENIMLENRSADAQIKLIDFGLSTKFQPDENLTDGVGTIYTMAPEVLQGDYTYQADMWSVGVITYILIANRKPFYSPKRRTLVQKILEADFSYEDDKWINSSCEIKDFIKSLIELDPKKRLTAEKALESEWLTKLNNDEEIDLEYLEALQQKMCVHADSSILKKMSLLVVAHRSAGKDVSDLRNAFKLYDENNDGLISYEEFKTVLDKVGYKEERIKELFDELDVDKSGMINYTEFVAATLETQGRIEEDKVAEAFSRIDSDGTGRISLENLRAFIGQDTKSQFLKQTIQELDRDNDGEVSYNEFRSLFERRASLLYEENKEHYRESLKLLDNDETEADEEKL